MRPRIVTGWVFCWGAAFAIVHVTMRLAAVTVLFASLLVVGVVPAAAAPRDDGSFALQVLELTNAERHKAGLTSLTLNQQLNDAAQTYSQVLASTGCFEHTCGPVPNFADRAGQAGYTGWSTLGENIAAGYPSADAVVAGWMESPAHRANILSPKFTEMGVGLVNGGGTFGTYWAQEFGGRPGMTQNAAPLPEPEPQAAGQPTATEDGSGA
jgi:uncharacterized protein YkwD